MNAQELQLYAELLIDASQYKTYSAWRRKSYGNYRKAKRRGWHKSIVEEAELRLLAKSKTYEDCLAISSRYSTLGEWYRKDYSSYYYVYRKGWLTQMNLPRGKAGRPRIKG